MLLNVDALVGLVSFGLIYARASLISSGGSAQRVESAKKTLRNAVIGLIIALLATWYQFSLGWFNLTMEDKF